MSAIWRSFIVIFVILKYKVILLIIIIYNYKVLLFSDRYLMFTLTIGTQHTTRFSETLAKNKYKFGLLLCGVYTKKC